MHLEATSSDCRAAHSAIIRDVTRGWSRDSRLGDFEQTVVPGTPFAGMDADQRSVWPGGASRQACARVDGFERAPSCCVPVLNPYLYLALNSKTSATSTGYKHLSSDDSAEIRSSLLRRAEQRRIVSAIESYFTRLDAAVATLERVQRNLKRYRASVLKAAVEGRLVPTEAELARAEGRELRARLGPPGAHPRRTPTPLGGSRAGEDEGQGQGAEGRQVEGEVRGAGRAGYERLAGAPQWMGLGHVDQLAT